MKKIILIASGALALVIGAYLILKPAPTAQVVVAALPAKGDPIVEVTLPDTLSSEAQIGKRAFEAVCAACHGLNAAGAEGAGPPLVHMIYEPNHHGDMAFLSAVQRGVQSHHWRFGNMPPQTGLTGGDVKAITAYVRELQRANGIK
ncbi:MAG TPA: cytochrome c [Paracoccaceae bacterium]|nr:cytochrome c [Paracoccaceae bacterium]